MAGKRRQGRRFITTAHKPHGVIQPRVERVGAERFGIVSIDSAKALLNESLKLSMPAYGEVRVEVHQLVQQLNSVIWRQREERK